MVYTEYDADRNFRAKNDASTSYPTGPKLAERKEENVFERKRSGMISQNQGHKNLEGEEKEKYVREKRQEHNPTLQCPYCEPCQRCEPCPWTELPPSPWRPYLPLPCRDCGPCPVCERCPSPTPQLCECAGEKGEPGKPGPRGVTGESGYNGPRGITGNDGSPGPEGVRGSPGPHGSRGLPGRQGEQGALGISGPRGPVGERGDRGSPGLPGPQGVQGAQGPPGLSAENITVCVKFFSIPLKMTGTEVLTFGHRALAIHMRYMPTCGTVIGGVATYQLAESQSLACYTTR